MRIHVLPPAVAILAAVSMCTLVPIAQAQALTADQAREIVTPFYGALSAGNDAIALLDQATSPDWSSCGGSSACRQRDQVGAAITGLQKTVPDLKWEIRDVLIAGDRVVVRGEASGTPAGTFMGVSSGGRSFRIMSIDVHTIKDGRIAQTYHVEDWMGAVRQLSAP